MPSICATHDRLLRAPRTTIAGRGRESGGGEDDLEPPTLAAWATAAAPAVLVHHNYCWSHAASFFLRHCNHYFFVGVRHGDAQLGRGRRPTEGPHGGGTGGGISMVGREESTETLGKIIKNCQWRSSTLLTLHRNSFPSGGTTCPSIL